MDSHARGDGGYLLFGIWNVVVDLKEKVAHDQSIDNLLASIWHGDRGLTSGNTGDCWSNTREHSKID